MTSKRRQQSTSSLPVRAHGRQRQAQKLAAEWLSSDVAADDTTFHIPQAVNASSNNLLLDEDDDLDFLGAGDYTITLAQASGKDELALVSTPRNGRKRIAQTTSYSQRSEHHQEIREPADEYEGADEEEESRNSTPTPQARSSVRRVSATNCQASPGSTLLQHSSHEPTYTYTSPTHHRDHVRASPLSNISSPMPTAETTPGALRSDHMGRGDFTGEVGAGDDYRALSSTLITSPQAPTLREVSARSLSNLDVASSVSTATRPSASTSYARPAVRDASPPARAFQDDQHGGVLSEAEQVDTFIAKFKAPRASEHTMMDVIRPRPSTSSSRTDLPLALDVGSSSGLSALSETGVQDAEIQLASPDLPDIDIAAHAGRDALLREEVEDLQASPGAASIPKIGLAVPSAEASIEIRMVDRTAVRTGKLTNPASEHSKTKKPVPSVTSKSTSSSSSAFPAPPASIVNPERKRRLEIDFRSGKSEKLGGQSMKKPKLTSKPILDSTNRIDKTKADMNASPASLSPPSAEGPVQVLPPCPPAAHDAETTQHLNIAPRDTLESCSPREEVEPEHVDSALQPHIAVPDPCMESDAKAHPNVSDDHNPAVDPAPRVQQRTKIRDLDLRKMTKKPSRTTQTRLSADAEVRSSKFQKAVRPTKHVPQSAAGFSEISSMPSSSFSPTCPPPPSNTQMAHELPSSTTLHESASAVEAMPLVNMQASSELRDGEGSDRVVVTNSSTTVHSADAGASDIPDVLSASIPSLRQDSMSVKTNEHVAMALDSTGPKKPVQIDLDKESVEPLTITSEDVFESTAGDIRTATTSVPPRAPSVRPPTDSNVKVHPSDELKGKGKAKGNPNRQGSKRPEPPADDMFERKKRDTYLRKGIDLTAHSTTRFQKDAQARVGADRNKPRGAAVVAIRDKQKEPREGVSGSRPAAARRSVEERGASTLCRDGPIYAAGSTDTAVGTASEGSHIKLQPVVPAASNPNLYNNDYYTSPSLIPISADEACETELFDANLESNGSSSNREMRNHEKEDPANTSSSSIGNVIAERLVSFGQKVIGTLGLLSSHSEPNQNERKIKPLRSTSHVEASLEAQPQRNTRTSPLRLSELSPRKVRDWDARPGCEAADERSKVADEDDMDYRDVAHGAGFDMPEIQLKEVSHEEGSDVATMAGPSEYPNRKRSARPDEWLTEGTANGPSREDEHDEHIKKRSKLSEAISEGMTASSSAIASKEKTLQTSSAASRKPGRTGGPVNSRQNPARKYNSSTASSSQRQNSLALHSKSKGNPKYFSSLTVPITTTFTGDLLQQQRAVAKAERQGFDAGKGSQEKERLTKSADDCSSARKGRVPLSDKQRDTNLPPKPTIPQGFNFETDARLAQRRHDFEDKMKTWERRIDSCSSSSLNGLSHSHKPIPDFKTLHAAHDTLLADMAARRREMIKPTVPVAPHFSTDQRLAEREKFEQARRLREEELERKLAEERRVREEEEERAYQEARKRAVPRANAIPEWYTDAPKKSSRPERVP